MMMNEVDAQIKPEMTGGSLTSDSPRLKISTVLQTPLQTGDLLESEPETIVEEQPLLHPVRSAKTIFGKFARKTRIIATLGPSTESGDVLRSLLKAGVSVFRLNMSHFRQDTATKLIYSLRTISTELNRPISLLLDSPSSAIRTGDSHTKTEDWEKVRFGLECNVDWIALSFVREAEDVRQLRRFLIEQKKSNVSIVARIEDQFALANVDEIITEADGIMVAHTGFGIGFPYEEMAIIQRCIVKKCRAARKPVIVATHPLESLVKNSLPTRAEIIGVANTVYEQADAIMLPEEISVGYNPLECVDVLDCVARGIEFGGNIGFQSQIELSSDRDKLVASAIHLANQTEADGIAVFTRQGHLANLCAALRPCCSPVFAFTPDARLARRLRLRYALEPIVLQFSERPKVTIHAAEKILLGRKFLAPGAKVVFITDILEEGQRISSVNVRVLAKKQVLRPI